MVAPIEFECEPGEVAELLFIVLVLMPVLMKVIAQAQIGKCLLHMGQGGIAKRMMHSDHEGVLQPAA